MSNRLEQYELIGTFGAGPLGSVLLGRDQREARLVRLHVLSGQGLEDVDRLRAFERASDVAGLIAHPGCSRIVDTAQNTRARVIATEVAAGVTLSEMLRGAESVGGGLPPYETVYVMIRVCEALHHAHEMNRRFGSDGGAHGGLSTRSVILTPDGQVKLRGFAGLDTWGRSLPTAESRGPTQADDIFAVGVTLFECLTGARFEAAGPNQSRRLRDVRPSLSESLELICNRATAKDPSFRISSARELQLDLQAWLTGTGFRGGPRAVRRLQQLYAVEALSLRAAAYEAASRGDDEVARQAFGAEPLDSELLVELGLTRSPSKAVALTTCSVADADILRLDTASTGNIIEDSLVSTANGTHRSSTASHGVSGTRVQGRPIGVDTSSRWTFGETDQDSDEGLTIDVSGDSGEGLSVDGGDTAEDVQPGGFGERLTVDGGDSAEAVQDGGFGERLTIDGGDSAEGVTVDGSDRIEGLLDDAEREWTIDRTEPRRLRAPSVPGLERCDPTPTIPPPPMVSEPTAPLTERPANVVVLPVTSRAWAHSSRGSGHRPPKRLSSLPPPRPRRERSRSHHPLPPPPHRAWAVPVQPGDGGAALIVSSSLLGSLLGVVVGLVVLLFRSV